MRKAFLVTLCLGMVLGLSVSALAEGIEIDGGYLLGNFDMAGIVESKANGFIISGEMPISGSFGAKVNFASVTGDEFKAVGIPVSGEMDATRFEALATYTLPFALPEGSSIKAVGGYSSATTNVSSVDEYGDPISADVTVSGFLVGAEGKFALGEKLSANGFFGFAVGMKAKADGYADSDMSLTTWQISAAYQITDSISAEVGYMSNTYTDEYDMDLTTDGFFLGARASF